MNDMSAISHLLAISSGPIGPATEFSGGKGQTRTLLEMLQQKNGYVAFQSALLVRPGFATSASAVLEIKRWNDPQIWRNRYQHLCPAATFFAEDVFGNQFGILEDTVIWFDVETGEHKFFADSIERWAETILNDYEQWTGFAIADLWQGTTGAIPLSMRLVMKRPFILGGKAAIENLMMWPDTKIMRARGAMAVQLENIPDGTEVTFELEP